MARAADRRAVRDPAQRRVTITDPDVIRASGSDQHPVLVPSDDPTAAIEGTSFQLTPEQLAAADAYEVDDYVRTRVPLRSGGDAWVYVLGNQGQVGASRGSGPAT